MTKYVGETQDNATTTTAQRTLTANVISETEKPAASAKACYYGVHEPADTPNVGSPQKWEKERAEDERKEQHLKQVIEGICRGC